MYNSLVKKELLCCFLPCRTSKFGYFTLMHSQRLTAVSKQRKSSKANILMLCSRYSLLMVLILQLAITSILCATSSYTANANTTTICTALGLKTITLDENGEPIEQEQHDSFSTTCFHCSSGCSTTVMAEVSEIILYPSATKAYVSWTTDTLITKLTAHGPPSRAPPTHA